MLSAQGPRHTVTITEKSFLHFLMEMFLAPIPVNISQLFCFGKVCSNVDDLNNSTKFRILSY